MFAGEVREAVRLLSRNPNGGPLSLDAPAFPDNPAAGSVLDQLQLKHDRAWPSCGQFCVTAANPCP